MKAKFAIAAIALAMTSASAFASLENLTGGTVNIAGSVRSSSCNVSVMSEGVSANDEIRLPAIDVSELSNTRIVAQKPFTLEVYGCNFTNSSVGKDILTATWVAGDLADGVDAEKGYLKNTLKGQGIEADNVYLVVLDNYSGYQGDVAKTRAVVPNVKHHQQAQQLTSATGTTFFYRVGYGTEDRTQATAGELKSNLTYMLSYK